MADAVPPPPPPALGEGESSNWGEQVDREEADREAVTEDELCQVVERENIDMSQGVVVMFDLTHKEVANLLSSAVKSVKSSISSKSKLVKASLGMMNNLADYLAADCGVTKEKPMDMTSVETATLDSETVGKQLPALLMVDASAPRKVPDVDTS